MSVITALPMSARTLFVMLLNKTTLDDVSGVVVFVATRLIE